MFAYFVKKEKNLIDGLKFLHFSSNSSKVAKIQELEHPFEKIVIWMLDL